MPDNPWDKIWADQADFNRGIRPDPQTFEEKSAVTSDMVLNLEDELHELLRTVKWKKHRHPRRITTNLAHTTEEIVDAFKYLITIAQVWDISPSQLMEGYWKKSAVCRQRYSEEWVKREIDGPVILLDLDMVLANYVEGFGDWLLYHCPYSSDIPSTEDTATCIRQLISEKGYLSAKSTKIPNVVWEALKHQYRTSGFKAVIPPMPHAQTFVRWCRARAMVILLTARPIDRYPNMLTDTVAWLSNNDIRVDHIWWSADKGKVIELEDIKRHVLFAVDDDPRHIAEYAKVGVTSYWLTNREVEEEEPYVIPVQSLTAIMEDQGA